MRGIFCVVKVLQASPDGLCSLYLEILSWINFSFRKVKRGNEDLKIQSHCEDN
jgi:hypothetical protein